MTPHAYDLLAGLIWSFFCGFAMASYATSFTFRLPRGEPILLAEKPFCDHCRTPLQPRDLFSVFSWLASGGKCRHCGAKISSEHFWTEICVIAVFVASYLAVGRFSEAQLLLAFFGVALITHAVIAFQHGYSEIRALVGMALFAVAARTLADHSVLPLIHGFLAAVMISYGLGRLGVADRTRRDLLLVAGMMLPLPWFLIATAALFPVLRYVAPERASKPLTVGLSVTFYVALLLNAFFAVGAV